MNHNLLVILGPTACGKTRLAVAVADALHAEIISADSRQVYTGMDIGTGKDLSEYQLATKKISYHLIDLLEPGEEYNVFRFRKDFFKVFREIRERGHLPLMCGGTGLYIESVINNYKFQEVPENEDLRAEMQQQSMTELVDRLSRLRPLHSTTDIVDRNRLYRALEIAIHQDLHHSLMPASEDIHALIVGVSLPRDLIRERITHRLQQRLSEGMIEEVQQLLERGVPAKRLLAFGLEYKWITRHLQGELSSDEMFTFLNTAIHQFAKRQTTWFRRMERQGTPIHWIDGRKDEAEKVNEILRLMKPESA